MSCATATEIRASAVVLANAPGRVQLAVTRQSACKACAEKSQCGSRQESTRPQRIWLASSMPLILGQTVAVSMPENALLRAALLMYGLPLTGFMLGLLSGTAFGDIAALLCAVTGLACGFATVRFLAHRLIAPLRVQADAAVFSSYPGANPHD